MRAVAEKEDDVACSRLYRITSDTSYHKVEGRFFPVNKQIAKYQE